MPELFWIIHHNHFKFIFWVGKFTERFKRGLNHFFTLVVEDDDRTERQLHPSIVLKRRNELVRLESYLFKMCYSSFMVIQHWFMSSKSCQNEIG